MPALGAALDTRASGVLCMHHHGHTVLEGEDSQGHWRTAGAKTYPEGLCKVLAQGVSQEAWRRCPWIFEAPLIPVPRRRMRQKGPSCTLGRIAGPLLFAGAHMDLHGLEGLGRTLADEKELRRQLSSDLVTD
eukprot:7311123-Pyramimonas_sp.AAC.1